MVKPETGEYPEYVANEMFCMTVCRQVGIPVAKATVKQIAGRCCLVSPRYDRVVGEGRGEVRRLHCESFWQALGIPSGTDEDREDSDAPGWTEARGLLNAVSRPDEVVNLLTAAFCNYILGNGDVHGKNFALIDRDKTSLSGPGRKWRLAPLTDITSTVVYDNPIHHGLVISEEYQETSTCSNWPKSAKNASSTSKSCAGWRRQPRAGSAWRWRRSRALQEGRLAPADRQQNRRTGRRPFLRPRRRG